MHPPLYRRFRGALQIDGYAAYRGLADPRRAGGHVTLAYCWSHCRRQFYEIAEAGHAEIAEEALSRIATIYAVEAELCGRDPNIRRAGRQAQSKPLVGSVSAWISAERELALIARVLARAFLPICPREA